MADASGGLLTTSDYVAALDAELADLVRALRPRVTRRLVDEAQRFSARLSVRLDASPLDDATADRVDRGEGPLATGGDGGGARPPAGVPSRVDDGAGGPARASDGRSGWAGALRLDGLPTQEIAALEYAGVRAAQADEPALAAGLLDDPLRTLAGVHRRIAAGLVADDRLGALRTTSRAVHDAQGMVILASPPPHALAELLSGLERWIAAARDRVGPLELAGVVHARLLHWRPFEAGNGRVARAASRVALRATGGDPWGVAVPERVYADDPLAYVREVGATVRRRGDVRPWVERTGEAIVSSLERTARGVEVTPAAADPRAVDACGGLAAGDTVTVPHVARVLGVDRRAALRTLGQLCWSGLLERDPGTRGLRYVRTAHRVP